MHIGPHHIDTPIFLAPMAGISDQPFRQICHKMGAGLCVSEMLASKPELWATQKSQHRFHLEDAGLKVVQLVGTEASQLAESAKHYAELGADIIDINMGCPAKKVCKKAAGSALLREPELVEEICRSVVEAVEIPVTLKIRTGWCQDTRNAVEIAHIAEDSGIQSLVIHGRTRACRFKGHAEYDTIAQVKQSIAIPVIANGDITTPEQAKFVLDYTQADGVMIGRAAQGNPWIFHAMSELIQHERHATEPTSDEIFAVMQEHIQGCEDFYGEFLGPKIARKHAIAYFENWFEACIAKSLRQQFNVLENCHQQLSFINQVKNTFHSPLQSRPQNNKEEIAA